MGLPGLLVSFLTVMAAADAAQLAREADTVVHARVVESKSRWDDSRRHIVTESVLEVVEAWKGKTGRRVTVLTRGGVVDDIDATVVGEAEFERGAEVVVFLHALGGGKRFRVAAMAQGKLDVLRRGKTVQVAYRGRGVELVDGRPPGPRPLAALRAEIKQAAAEARP